MYWVNQLTFNTTTRAVKKVLGREKALFGDVFQQNSKKCAQFGVFRRSAFFTACVLVLQMNFFTQYFGVQPLKYVGF